MFDAFQRVVAGLAVEVDNEEAISPYPDAGEQRRNAGALLCDEHYSAEMSRRSRGTGSSNGHVAVNGLVGQVKELEALARRLEKARQRAAPAVAELKAAQQDWDAAVAGLSEKTS